LEGTGHILLRGTVPACLEGLGKTMPTVRMFGLAAGIRTYDFGMEVAGVSACAKLIREIVTRYRQVANIEFHEHRDTALPIY